MEGVACADLLADAEIHVLERGLAARITAVGRQQVQQPVRIGGAAAQDESRAVFHDGAFQMQTARQQADAQRAFHLLAVAFPRPDFHHGRDAAAILGRNRALEEFHVADDVGVESGEDAEHVVRVVDGTAVEEDEVLVGGAAAHIEAAGSFAHRLDTRQGHHHLQGVGLAKDHRHVLDHIDADLLDAQLGGPVLRHTLRGDDGPFQREDLLLHHYVESAVAIDHQVELQILQRIAAEAQLAGSHRQGQFVVAIFVGRGETLARLVIHRYAHQRFPAGGIVDIALHRRTAASAGTLRVADLVDLVLEGHRDASLLIQDAVLCGLDRFLAGKIAGREDRPQVAFPRHDIFPVVLPHLVAAFPQRGKCFRQELFPRRVQGVVPFVSRIFHEIDIRRNLGTEEGHERVGFHLGNAERLRRILRRKHRSGAKGCEQKQQIKALSHCDSTYLRTSTPYSSRLMLRLKRSSRAAICRRISRRRAGNRIRTCFLERTGTSSPVSVMTQ